jgi:quinoprotein glucose dehydrogenase
VKIPRTGMIGKISPLTTKALVICGDPMTYTDETGRKGARLRAYDKATGEEKGAVFMPAEQSGSPMTYMLGGRQYIVVAIGGRNFTSEFIAFKLPGSEAPAPRRRGQDN